MVPRRLMYIAALVALLRVGAPGLLAQGSAALTGTVSAPREGKLEGVLVTARRDGANFDVTVVSDAKGQYRFPSTHIGPGKYSIKVRATGYDLTSPNTVEVAQGKAAKLDLTLDKAKDLSAQISSTEWLLSIPGTEEQKNMVQKQIASCTYCHSLERVLKSRHNADQFYQVIQRMSAYYFDGTMAGTEGRGRAVKDDPKSFMYEMAAKSPNWGFMPGVDKHKLAEYLATVNRNGNRPLPELKTLPRPKGAATRVIITQYDMPRKDTVPHDSDVDSKGNVWYTDQTDYFVGVLDAKTGTFREWPLPKPKTHLVGGGSDVQVDKDDNVWFPLTVDGTEIVFGRPGKFDPKTGIYTPVDKVMAQFMALAPDGSIVAGGDKIDPKTMRVLDNFDAWMKAPNAPAGQHMGYEAGMDSKGNYYITDWGTHHIVKMDARTKDVTFIKTPTAFSQPRRAKMDEQDRFWFAEYTGDALGVLDTKTEKIDEFPLGPWTGPYAPSTPDRKGRVYVASGASDRVYRVDPKTRATIAYLMPTRDFDSKQVTIDPTNRSTVWMANTRNARIIKVEPLD